MVEILIIGVIAVLILSYTQKIDTNKFIKDNEQYFKMLKEDDYEFLVRAKYGDSVEVEKLFALRLRNALFVVLAMLFIFLNKFNFINVTASILAGIFMFKYSYLNLKAYYKKHLHDIDLMLPYYLKSIEILIQHYTVPVAIAKSIDDAPDMFKPGLRTLISKINAGDSSIDPYVDFSKEYPVRDSMRMMRLLYRLGLGNQENKYEQLLMFSRTVSTLQNKARETKYKERLNTMENKTMVMLSFTGVSVMIMLLISMLQMI